MQHLLTSLIASAALLSAYSVQCRALRRNLDDPALYTLQMGHLMPLIMLKARILSRINVWSQKPTRYAVFHPSVAAAVVARW